MGTLSVRLCGITHLFSLLPIYVSTYIYILVVSSVHFTRMFSLLVEYGLVHRGDCINCEKLFLV